MTSIKTKKQALSIALGLAILSGIFLVCSATAQRADIRILDSAFITSDADGASTVEIRFTCGVRYKAHFPHSEGSELRIRIAPVTCPADRDAEFRREAIRPKKDNAAALLEILYEGDIPGGPYLTLYFSRSVGFQVAQGSDFRSLTVKASNTAPDVEAQ